MMGGKIDMSNLISTMKDKMSSMMNDVQQGKIKTMSRVIDDMSHSIWECPRPWVVERLRQKR